MSFNNEPKHKFFVNIKKCERCGKEFDNDKENICLECAMEDEMNAIGEGIKYLFLLLLCFLPFGIWKVIEIIIWVFNHLHWS